jgi:hypothetical protein
MLPTLVLTAQSATTEPVEVHACQPTHWFLTLFCWRTTLVRLEMILSMLQGAEYLARLPTSFYKPAR